MISMGREWLHRVESRHSHQISARERSVCAFECVFPTDRDARLADRFAEIPRLWLTSTTKEPTSRTSSRFHDRAVPARAPPRPLVGAASREHRQPLFHLLALLARKGDGSFAPLSRIC
jgi:hypothetical protein